MTGDVVAWWFGLAFLGGAIAAFRGRSFIGYFLLGVVLTPLMGIICAAFAGRRSEVVEDRAVAAGTLRRCPSCAEAVRREASICRYCRQPLTSVPLPATTARAYSRGFALARVLRGRTKTM